MIYAIDKRKLLTEIKRICMRYDMDVTEISESYSSDRADGLKIFEMRLQVADFQWKHGVRREWKDTE